MAREWVKRSVLAAACAAALCMAGCHADDNDPKGQSEELQDPVRREHAITRLQSIWNTLLSEAKGDKKAKPIVEFCDITVENITKAYLDHPEDSVNRLKMLGLLQEMLDPRSLPVMMDALNWTAEVSEDHAILAARAVSKMDLPDADRGKAVEAIAKALEKVSGPRPLDNRLRQAFIDALGVFKDKRATDVLVKVALSQESDQNFLFNILAAQQLEKIADPKSVPDLIKMLYLSDPANPAMRMNDVAASALVAIGKPALQPMIDTLQGKNKEANELVKLYIDSIRQKDSQAAAKLKTPNIVSAEATYTLGKLGYREALQPLIDETKNEDVERAYSAALALIGINRKDEDTKPIVDAMISVYERSDKQQRPQMLVAMRHLYADEIMPFLFKIAETTETELPPIQMYGFVSYAMLADKAEAKKLPAIIEKEELIRPQLKEYEPAIKAAEECDRDIKCWEGKLQDKDTIVARKAANMLARLARGNDEATSKVVELFGHEDLEVRNEALYAVDYMAVKGSKAAVDKIDQLEAAEGGRSIWNNFKREALPGRARIAARK